MDKKTGGLIIKTIDKLELIIKAADERLAQEIIAMDVASLTPLADYFVVMHASNDRQLSAVVEEIIDQAHKNNITVKNTEGKSGSKWVLIDLNDIIVHVFHHSERANYNLEKIWQDASLVDIHEWIS